MLGHVFRVSTGALIVALVASTVLMMALPAAAGPGAQDWEPIPTPSMSEPTADDLAYVLTTEGGVAVPPQMFPDQTVEDVVFGETTVTSEFPDQMIFQANITAEREIKQVKLFITHHNGADESLSSKWEAELQAYTAKWPLSKRFPAWAAFRFRWCVTDANQESICSDPQPITLIDPVQQWYRAENNYAILYWFGFGDDDPDQIAERFTRAVAATQPRRVAGFGRDLSYKPINLIYPDAEAFKQVLGWGMTEGDSAYEVTLGMNVQVLMPSQVPAELANCIYYPADGIWDMEYRLYYSVDWGITVGMTALHVGDVLHRLHSQPRLGGASWSDINYGEPYWFYGQLKWFAAPEMNWEYDARVRHLATLGDIQTLSSYTWALYMGADGCSGQYMDLGASFINWLVGTYGIDTHRQIVELMTPTADHPLGMFLKPAIEQVTGKPFAELEAEWHAYLGLPLAE
jgi:hypothetical protein